MKLMKSKRLQNGLLAGVFSAASLGANAGDLSLVDSPLFLVNSVQPNIFITLDDSASMLNTLLLKGTTDGIFDIGAFGVGFYAYGMPGADNGVDKALNDQFFGVNAPLFYCGYAQDGICWATPPSDAAVPGQGLWRFSNSKYNFMHYDPTVTYEPWAGTDSGGAPLYADSNPSAAPVDPTGANPYTLALNASYRYNAFSPVDGSLVLSTIWPAHYYTWTDTDANGEVDATDAHTLVEIKTGSTYTGGASRTDCAAAPTCTYAEEIQNFANWYTYYRGRGQLAKAALGQVIDNQSGYRMGLWHFTGGLEQAAISMSDAANKRDLLTDIYSTAYSAGATPARSATQLLGTYFQASQTNGWTPIQSSADGGECQQNFNLLVTDGFWNCNATQAGFTGCVQPGAFDNNDSDGDTTFDGGVYADGANADTPTLADIAMEYYENDLMPTLADRVPTVAGGDQAEHQHLVVFAVAMGAAGTLDPTGTVTPGDATDTDPTDAGFAWPAVTSGTASTIDDLWHASFNTRGDFFAATDAASLITSLTNVFDSIADRTSSSSSVALSSGFLSSDSLLFQARFDSSTWTGQLLAFSITATGPNAGAVATTSTWDAAVELAAQDWNTGRVILTSRPHSGSELGGTGVAFRWPANPASPTATEITTAQVTALNLNPDSAAADALGGSRVQHLRGGTVGGMRTRTTPLGDVVDSNPVYVGPPPFAYPDSLETPNYSTFAATYANRTPILYFGANDGMLHGINATTGASGGEEEVAYVPSMVYDNLPRLTSVNYGSTLPHRYYVNGTPTAGDVVIGSNWKTILVSGLGKGGQGLFALDITNPGSFTEANASSLVLWEFDDSRDSDLGYTYGQPAIVRLHNGSWGVVIGNGYNATENDGSSSGDGDAHIYILDVADGSIIKKFDTKTGTAEDPTAAGRPNGITTVTPIDLDGDNTVDFIYAPDLFGNVWKLDVSNTNTSQWDFAFKSGSTPEPLYTAVDSGGAAQAITTAVDVALHPAHAGLLVYFGTGKYVEDSDPSAVSQTQTFYAVWDRSEASNSRSAITRSHLLSRAIIEELTHANGAAVRVTDSDTTPLTWYQGTGLPGVATEYLGWYMDLVNTNNGLNTNPYGERIVSNPLIRNGRAIFVTLIPSANPCDFGGDSWLMELDAGDGSRLGVSPFDLNGDGVFSVDDFVESANVNVPTSGVKSDVGILPAPGILGDGNSGYAGGAGGGGGSGREFKYFSGTSGGLQTVTESRSAIVTGRQSWRQIK